MQVHIESRKFRISSCKEANLIDNADTKLLLMLHEQPRNTARVGSAHQHFRLGGGNRKDPTGPRRQLHRVITELEYVSDSRPRPFGDNRDSEDVSDVPKVGCRKCICLSLVAPC